MILENAHLGVAIWDRWIPSQTLRRTGPVDPSPAKVTSTASPLQQVTQNSRSKSPKVYNIKLRHHYRKMSKSGGRLAETVTCSFPPQEPEEGRRPRRGLQGHTLPTCPCKLPENVLRCVYSHKWGCHLIAARANKTHCRRKFNFCSHC